MDVASISLIEIEDYSIGQLARCVAKNIRVAPFGAPFVMIAHEAQTKELHFKSLYGFCHHTNQQRVCLC